METAAGRSKQAKIPPPRGVRFGNDVAFLEKHTGVVLLSDEGGHARVAVSPRLQGRIMTSTAGGADGTSFGWINRELLASKVNDPHSNSFGGEDRFWIGPEGGQFSVFFKPGAPFDLEHWFTPPPVNEDGFEVVSRAADRVAFKKVFRLVNYSGTAFDIEVDRTVKLLGVRDMAAQGMTVPPGIRAVAFRSDNRITNKGTNPWIKETGLLSIWILGMFNPSPATTIVLPFRPGPEAELGPIVKDAYFGAVPAERLVVGDGVLFFSGDGAFRSKIGIPSRRALPFAGSYDSTEGVLTIIQLTIPKGAADYVNSMWRIQDDPYTGDVVNSYNDGPASPGVKPLGPFYELESSSPAAALLPGRSMSHAHTTMHFQGDEQSLDALARQSLGAGIEEIKNALKPGRPRISSAPSGPSIRN